ncbi:MAG: hypothetical protein R3F62_08535 [Planctomycetota bacterium]
MSDEALRHLERRWSESGALEDEVALIRQRLRAGATTQQRVDLAAFLGSPAAAALSACAAQELPADYAWELALELHHGALAVQRVELALLRGVAPVTPGSVPDRLLAQLERCAVNRAPAELEALERLRHEPLADFAAQRGYASCVEWWSEQRHCFKASDGRWLREHPYARRLQVYACGQPEHVLLQVARALAEERLAPPPEVFEGSSVFALLRDGNWSQPNAAPPMPWEPLLDQALRAVARWALGHDLALAAPGPLRPEVRLYAPSRELLRLERAAEDDPADQLLLEALVRRSYEEGWRFAGHLLAEYRVALERERDLYQPDGPGALATELARLGVRAVPLAIDALPSHAGLWTLRLLGRRARAAGPALTELLAHPDAATRRGATDALAAIATRARPRE